MSAINKEVLSPDDSMLILKTVSGRLRELFRGREKNPVGADAGSDRRNLLVVDDEESICFSMREYFSQHGYKVDTAREMEEAEKLLGTSDYRVVIQDLRLSLTTSSDGLEMIRTIREHNPQTRIIVLTAYGSAEVEDEARRCGADAQTVAIGGADGGAAPSGRQRAGDVGAAVGAVGKGGAVHRDDAAVDADRRLGVLSRRKAELASVAGAGGRLRRRGAADQAAG